MSRPGSAIRTAGDCRSRSGGEGPDLPSGVRPRPARPRIPPARLLAVVAAAIWACLGGCQHAPATATIYDGFEGEALSSHWRTDKLAKGAAVIQSEEVRSGHGALRITLHPGDPTPEISAGANERDEIQERDAYDAREGEAYAYEFSLLVPRGFPIVPTRLVLAQWKQDDGGGRVAVDHPLIALRYVGGELSVTIQHADEQRTYFRTREDIRGRWLDFVFHIRHSRGDDGAVRAWMNRRQIVDYRGPTAYSDLGYPSHPTFYFKMGLYRDDMDEPMTLFIDEYRKRPLAEGAAGRHDRDGSTSTRMARHFP